MNRNNKGYDEKQVDPSVRYRAFDGVSGWNTLSYDVLRTFNGDQ